MARKWAVFFRQVESVLKRGFRFILLGMLGLIFALGIPTFNIAHSHSVTKNNSKIARVGGLRSDSPSLQAAENIANSQPAMLMERGRELYRSDRYDEAAETLQQAADLYAAQGNRLNQSLALSYLSLTYQKLGEGEAAQRVSDVSLQLAGMGETRGDRIARAVALNSQGHLLLSFGDAETAFERWQNAATEYEELNDSQGKVGALVNQAQALEQMGYYRRSCNTLLEAVGAETLSCDELETEEDINSLKGHFEEETNPEIQAIALRSLGNVLRAIGKLDRSHQILEQTLVIVDKINSKTDKSLTLFALANTEQALAKQKQEYGETDNAKDYRNQAVNFYKQAIEIAPSPTIQLLAQLNLFSLLRQSETNPRELETLLTAIQSQMSEMKLSKPLVEARIKLACSLMQCEKLVQGETAELALVSIEEIDGLLQQAVIEAKKLEDTRLISYAIGTQGKRYESFLPPQEQKQGDNPSRQKAKSLTQEALALAVQNNAPELRYQWQWQMGRLLAGEGNLEDAIGNYTEAVETLDLLRNDLLPINSEVQFSFRDNVEPVYRQFVNLLLTQPTQNHLQEARLQIDNLQLAELENYLNCRFAAPQKQESQVLPNTAVLYPIILSNRLEVIVEIPGQPLYHYQPIPLSEATLQDVLEKLRLSLEPEYFSADIHEMSGIVYDWLIRPGEESFLFSDNQITNLVFVLDKHFRNIPMAALYDGEKYLVEKYALAIALNLNFPLSQQPKTLKALIGGLSVDPTYRNFSPLENVPIEVQSIEDVFEVTTVLLDNRFTKDALKRATSRSFYPIVHLATHGQFSSNPQETFLLVLPPDSSNGDRNDEQDRRIDLNELTDLMQNQEREPIELLVLSACETAKGDNRAALGLAGVTIRAGAKSTVATLWSVDDKSTSLLFQNFYQALIENNVNKAEALRLAQLELLKQKDVYDVPHYWAAYVIVGNWQSLFNS